MTKHEIVSQCPAPDCQLQVPPKLEDFTTAEKGVGEGCKQPNAYYVVGSGVHLFLCVFFLFVFLRSGETCVRSVKDYDPGAHLSFGDVLLDSTVDPQVAQVNIKAS